MPSSNRRRPHSIGKQDSYRAFLERSTNLVRNDGLLGMVVPSAFHANEGATGVRQLYLEELGLETCFSFENRRAIFEIHRSFKFAVVVARRTGPTTTFRCAFYIHDDEWLFQDPRNQELNYSLEFVRATGGAYLNLIELRSNSDLIVARKCFERGETFGSLCRRWNIRIGRELNISDDAWRFTPTAEVLPEGEDPRDPEVAEDLRRRGYFALHEGKTFHQFTDHWEQRPRYLVAAGNIVEKPEWLRSLGYYRLAIRKIARSTDERTAILSVLPVSLLVDSTNVERDPRQRPNCRALIICGVANTFASDWTIRIKASANVNLFILREGRVGKIQGFERFVAHSCLRLLSGHAGYETLWKEQLGEEWREATPKRTWPVLSSEDCRWNLRAAMDGAVAHSFDLERDEYQHILSTFSHTSYKRAPALCLAKFDELAQIGRESFIQKYDPYWDIPLNTGLPKPVIEIPGLETQSRAEEFSLTSPTSGKRRRRRKRST